MVFNSIFLVLLGVLPSTIWLLFYLRKDCHPEPKSLIAKTFLMGIIVSPIAVGLQAGFSYYFSSTTSQFLLWAAFIEEMVKFLAVRIVVFRDPEFDEPIDALVYMIIAGLGFAAVENILVMFNVFNDGAQAALSVWALRATGATLLHALSSGLLGYFLALSWHNPKSRKKLVTAGIILATLFHFTFNITLSATKDRVQSLASTTILLIAMAFLLSLLFDKLRNRHGREDYLVKQQVSSA